MKKYLVLYYNGDETKAKALNAPDQSSNSDGFPNSSNALLWGLSEDDTIVAVIGIPDLSVEKVTDLSIWIDEQEVILDD